MIVRIKPIDKKKWHGKEGIESFSQPTKIKALYDTKTGRYATGLSESEREDLEKRLDVDLSDVFNPSKPHPFWDTEVATLTLPNHTIILDTSKPLEYIKYSIAKASKFVANSFEAYNRGEFPEATHIIFDEEAEVKYKAEKAQLKKEAYKIALKMKKADKISIITILLGKDLSNQSDEFIDVAMDEILEKHTEKFIDYQSKPAEYKNTKALLIKAHLKNIVIKKANHYYYMDFLLGTDLEDAVTSLLKDENQQIRLAIIDKME